MGLNYNAPDRILVHQCIGHVLDGFKRLFEFSPDAGSAATEPDREVTSSRNLSRAIETVRATGRTLILR
jgi:hypothetical protein